MKRINDLYDSIYDLKNLYSAFYKAYKGKQKKADANIYRDDLADRIQSLRKSLKDETYQLGRYYYFKVYDPKERLICAADFNERVLHHSIINVCGQVFDSHMIYDSYACRKGKGLHRSIRKLAYFSRDNDYYLKLDIKKYFDSIDHDILYRLIQRKFKDIRLLRLFRAIIDSYCIEEGKGIPIGNLTSQYFANYYLSFMDHYIKEVLRVKHYVRYMDDFVLLAKDKSQIRDWLCSIKEYLIERLYLQIKPPVINNIDNGIVYCGFKIYRDRIHLSRRSRDRFRHKFYNYESNYIKGSWTINDLYIHVQAIIGWTMTADAVSYRRNMIYGQKAVSMELEPHASRRKLEQQRSEPAVSKPEQQFAGQPEQQ